MNKKLAKLTALIAALLALLFPGSPVHLAKLGGTAGSVPAAFSTSSTVAVGQAAVVVLFPTTPAPRQCSARRVTTDASPVYILFDNTATSTLQLSQGHLQAASTTVDYPAEHFGCEDWIVKGAGAASSTITISEFRQ